KDSIGKINTVAPPTSTLTGLGIYESALPPIGEIGATICSRWEQLSSIIRSDSSTCSSSHPIINVVFPSFRKPPVVANLVVWKLLSFNALTSVVESLSCTTAIISFIFHTSLFVINASHTLGHLLSLGRSMLLHQYA